ncbi:phage portal protein [Caulobacter sp. Root343]|uniref:phage portal protein n=1 Tax=Caulobacter sp. Root343 TaxID=1736520 RepID=UPI00138F0C44|nr:phage portal protein [Caulobacter sp. Root343]
MIDRTVEWFSPSSALQRTRSRLALDEMKAGAQELERRRYEAAQRSRTSGDWRGNGLSGNANLSPDLSWIRARVRHMEQNQTEVATAVRNLTVDLTGLDIRAAHPTKQVVAKAQKAWSAFHELLDYVVKEKVIVREVILGGEVLIVLRPRGKKPSQRIQILPGEQLDQSKTEILANGNTVVMGVERDAESDVVAYWIFPNHPGDMIGTMAWASERIEARYVLHVFEELWPDQARGVPWFYASVLTDDEIEQLRTALRVKRRVEACLSIHVTPGEGGREGDLLGSTSKDDRGRQIDKLAPGMVLYGKAGDKVEVINPSASGGADAFVKSEVMRASAAKGVPHHIVSGDVSNANYSSLRADIVPYHRRLDDWIYTVFGPKLLKRLFKVCMELAVLETGDKRLLDVRGEIAVPERAWVDPYKDIMALKERLRLFPGQLPEVMARMGIDWREAFALQAEVNEVADADKLIYDADPRLTAGSGAIQAGLMPADGQDKSKAA